jgi:hypothetical protein
MAAAYAANNMLMDPGTMGVGGRLNDDTVHARHLTISGPIEVDRPQSSSSSLSSQQPSPRTPLPPPNPPFVFPPRSPSAASVAFWGASGQRPRSAIESNQRQLDFSCGPDGPSGWGTRARRSPALPDFSFNPGATLSPDSASDSRQPRSPGLPDFTFNPSGRHGSESALLNRPVSPLSTLPPSARGTHRRGGSEFVGGHLRNGNSITVMNTSPTRPESLQVSPSPSLTPVDPSPQRRGRHAHRRSAAISSHDLSVILKPSNNPNPSAGSNAPATPADPKDKYPPLAEAPVIQPQAPQPSELAASKLEEKPIRNNEDDEQPPTDLPSPADVTDKPISRARVGFSDTLEYIPRPLSLISTDTTSTMAGRNGHSVTSSISSIISLATSTATSDRDMASPRAAHVGKQGDLLSDYRPSTAGAVLERTPSLHAIILDDVSSPRRRNSIPLLNGLPPATAASASEPSPIKTPKRWSFFGLESLALPGSPAKPRPHSAGSAEMATKNFRAVAPYPEAMAVEGAMELSDPLPKKRSGKKKEKKEKKEKKVKLWAGAILTRKPKSQKSRSGRRRSMTPPIPPRMDLDFDDHPDEYYVNYSQHPATAPMVMITGPPTDADLAGPCAMSDDETSYPMIDLDAALGPFNTPSARDPAWDAAQRTGATPKRQLHSAAGLRGFSGPGMHYHRRTESAPEMPPFEGGRAGIHRFGSSSTMADVFEEDEEDDDDDEAGSSSTSEESTPDSDNRSVSDDAVTPTQEVDIAPKASRDSFPSPTTLAAFDRKGSAASLDVPPPVSRARTNTSSSSLHEEIIFEEAPFQKAVDQGRIYETYVDCDSAAPSPRRILTKDSSLADVQTMNLPAPVLTPLSPFSASHSSSFPSPRSPMSFDQHRVSTAPSSVVDDNNFQSLLMGEPGPEVVRISVDIPSLTDSTSTMARDMNFPGVRPRNMPFHDQRPASFTSTAFGRRRSSLASLSRLISSAHGERSKLSVEVPLEADTEKKPKVSRSRRLSKMMQFWKPKESTKT